MYDWKILVNVIENERKKLKHAFMVNKVDNVVMIAKKRNQRKKTLSNKSESITKQQGDSKFEFL